MTTLTPTLYLVFQRHFSFFLKQTITSTSFINVHIKYFHQYCFYSLKISWRSSSLSAITAMFSIILNLCRNFIPTTTASLALSIDFCLCTLIKYGDSEQPCLIRFFMFTSVSHTNYFYLIFIDILNREIKPTLILVGKL